VTDDSYFNSLFKLLTTVIRLVLGFRCENTTC